MKHVLLLLLCIMLTFSCKNEEKQSENNTENTTQEAETQTKQEQKRLIALNGEFLFDGTTAVMQIGDNMYAVEQNDRVKELIEQCEPFKESKYDFVRIAVDGYIVDNPNEGWEKQIIVKRIINVRKSNADKNITIKSSK